MSKKHNGHYKKRSVRVDSNHSFFEKYPTLTVNRYWIPKHYVDAVHLTIQLYRDGYSFNRSADQANAVYPHLNRNKLVEHTLKFIANDY